jgi:hypothetical protein
MINKLNKYSDFILENNIIELLLESRLEFSKSFLNTLAAIKHPIARDIESLSLGDYDLTHNYIDVDMDKNDMVTFIRDARAQTMLKGVEIVFEVSNSSGHLKISDFSTEGGKAQNKKIYETLGWDLDMARKAPQGTKVRIISKLNSMFDSSKVYCLYESLDTDFSGPDGGEPKYKAVINQNSLTEVDSDIINKLWTTSRNPIRIGRLITSLLPLTGKTYSDSEKEKFVSEWKSVISIINDAFSKFGILEGENIYKYYQYDRYYNSNMGTLGNSCMSSATREMLAIYTDNPDVCKMVVKWADGGRIVDGSYVADKITGRALLWTTTDNIKFMDRIYTNDSSDEELFKKFAHQNGWWTKDYQNSSVRFTMQKNNESVRNPNLVVQLKSSYDDEYPYVDTLSYINTSTGKISNSSNHISANKLLNDTDGGYDYIGDDDYDDDY